jgi:hypothetical protein
MEPNPILARTSVAIRDHGQTNHVLDQNHGHDQTSLDPQLDWHIRALHNQRNNRHLVQSWDQLQEALFYLHLASKSPPFNY